MKAKILNLALIFTSFMGYLEWGTDQSAFLIETEIDILVKAFDNFSEIIHPFILLPLAGQIILVYTLFQKTPSKKLTYIGMFAIAILMVFIFLAATLSLNYKILFSAMPYLLVMFFIARHYKQEKSQS